MNIVCTICRDNFIQSDDISVIRCGHIFHFNCLSRWLTRSNSCPECRKKTSQEEVQRLYVTFATNESSSTDILSTQERIDSLKFQVLLNEKNIKYYTSKNEILEKQNAGLRQEVRKVESEINRKNSEIYLLKEQTRDLKEKFTEHESLVKHKLSQKEKEIERLQYEKKLLYDLATVEEVVERTDRDALVAYMKVMKKDMSRNARRWETLYTRIKKCLAAVKEVITLLKDQLKTLEITYDKHLDNSVTCLLELIYEMENLVKNSFKTCRQFNSISNNSRKLSESFTTDVQEVKISPSKTSTRQETGSLNSPSVEIEEVTVAASSKQANTKQENESSNSPIFLKAVIRKANNANQNKCPIPKKRAKLS